MTKYIRKRTRIVLLCNECMGLGRVATPEGRKRCNVCGGSGSVEGWIVELVREDEPAAPTLPVAR